MGENVRLSVRHLVEYAFRSGSIDSGFRTSSTLTEGTKAHQNVQRQYGEQDQKEVYLSAEIEAEELLFEIEGRCDGLLFTEDAVIIDEIKSTSRDIALIEEASYPVHWAQAKCYAYMYARKHNLERMRIQLTYVQVNTGAQKRFVTEASFVELASFVQETVRCYLPYAKLTKRHEQERDKSVKELQFPFPAYRQGQRQLAGAVYKTIAEGRKLFAKAPTGIGKTISTIFPAVKAIGEGHLQRMFYLTAKTITRTAAEDAFALLRAKGLQLRTVTITAKEKVCYQEEVRCSKEHCEYADGYYDRINEAMLDLLEHESLINRQVLDLYARKHKVCPFEFSLDAAYAADAVICDYNYVFDPRVSLKRLLEEQKKQTALLVDEAHNLVDRAREMYSGTLHKSVFLHVQREFKGIQPEVHAAAKAVNDDMLARRKQLGESRTRVENQGPDELVNRVEAFCAAAEKELTRSGAGHPLLLDAYFAAQSFCRSAKLYDERYVTFTEWERSEVTVKLVCLDPSHQLRQMGKGYRAHVFFSATLFPMPYYLDMLGGGEDDYSVSIPSPFAAEQLEVLIYPLSTRYQDRPKSYEPIAAAVHQLMEQRPGNYLVFFPSYEYMFNVYEAFMRVEQEKEKGVETIVQQMVMAEEERESFLAAFSADRTEALAGFAVMGGIFSEGIDLVGDRLKGVVVVGVGLPQIGAERDLIKSYMQGIGKNGYEYAYVFPGMNKVLQAGGRLIRSETDRGTLMLVDDRYLQPLYQRLLPGEWKPFALWKER